MLYGEEFFAGYRYNVIGVWWGGGGWTGNADRASMYSLVTLRQIQRT